MRVIFKDSFQTFSSSIINAVFFIVVIILNGTKGLKQPSDYLWSNLASNVVFDIDSFINSDFVLSRKRLPKLNSLNAILLIFGIFDDRLQKSNKSSHVMLQVLIAYLNKLVQYLQSEILVFFLVKDLHSLINQVVSILRIIQNIRHWGQTISQSFQRCFYNVFLCWLKTEKDSCQNEFLKMSIENKRFFVFKSLANETQSQNTDFLDQQVIVVNVWTDLFHDSVPFISGDLDAANSCNNIGSCSSDITIGIDHDTQHTVFDVLLGGRWQIIPETSFGLSLG